MKLNFLFDDKKFYKTLLTLAIPIVIQNLMLSSLNLVDNIIIGRLNVTAIASVGLANQYFFLLNLILFGISSGAAIFTAQYWGNKDLPNIKRVLGICLLTGVTAALLFTIGGLAFPKQILGIFSKDKNVIAMGSDYLRIIVFSYVMTSITFSFSFTLRSTGNVKPPMVVSMIALSINTILNYGLVYGYLGLPRMGIKGSALATLIARTIEVTLMLSIVYIKKYPIAASFKELTDLSLPFIRKFYRITMPVILNESIWALGVSIYAIVYAHMGTNVIASINISSTIERITWVIFMGFGNAGAVMIGNKIGEKKPKEAYTYAKRFIVIGPAFAMLAGVIVALGSNIILAAYTIPPLVHGYAQHNLYVFSVFLCARTFNFICIIGILRSGGDTKFSLFIDLGGVWFVGVPMAILAGWYLHLPVYYVYALVSLEEVFKIIFGLPRILSKKWINNLTTS
jgi:putative MATE family efflux protein